MRSHCEIRQKRQDRQHPRSAENPHVGKIGRNSSNPPQRGSRNPAEMATAISAKVRKPAETATANAHLPSLPTSYLNYPTRRKAAESAKIATATHAESPVALRPRRRPLRKSARSAESASSLRRRQPRKAAESAGNTPLSPRQHAKTGRNGNGAPSPSAGSATAASQFPPFSHRSSPFPLESSHEAYFLAQKRKETENRQCAPPPSCLPRSVTAPIRRGRCDTMAGHIR